MKVISSKNISTVSISELLDHKDEYIIHSEVIDMVLFGIVSYGKLNRIPDSEIMNHMRFFRDQYFLNTLCPECAVNNLCLHVEADHFYTDQELQGLIELFIANPKLDSL